MIDMYLFHSGNIVLKPKSSSKILERDVFTREDCEKSANVMVESADAYAAIVVWTPEQTGFASGKKEKRKDSMFSMWQTALEGVMEHEPHSRLGLRRMFLFQSTVTKMEMRNGCCRERRRPM